MQWPIGIVVILATSVAGNFAFMRAANNDPAFAIEPDYYRKAVAFDTTMREAQESAALGWSADASLVPHQGGRGTLEVDIIGRDGKTITADSVRAHAFFIARANDVESVQLAFDSTSGRYRADIPVLHLGQWEIRIDAYRAHDHFKTALRREVVVSGTSATPAK